MGLAINTNVTAMNAHRQLVLTSAAQADSTAKLSSGYRINSAADDPAGLANSEHLRAQMEGLGQAVNNANDAVNVMKTAEGALGESAAILRQMRDVAVHAANVGANDNAAAQADQTQIKGAIESLDRIANQTAFGAKKLLDGSGAMSATILNPSAVTSATTANSGSSMVAGYADVTVTTAATKATKTYAATTAYTAATDTVANAGTITVNGTAVTIEATDTVQDALDKINARTGDTGVTATLTAGGELKLDQSGYGSDKIIAYTESADIFNGMATDVATGTDAVATVTQGSTTTTFAAGKGNILKDAAGDIINLKDGGTTAAKAVYFSGGSFTFQIGANAGETVSAQIGSAKASDLGDAINGHVADIDITTAAGSQAAIKIIDAAIEQISLQRASIGSIQDGIQNTVNSLGIAQENITASESSIRDTDMAAEMVKFTRNSIMNQAGVSMLSQANQAPQAILSLLKG